MSYLITGPKERREIVNVAHFQMDPLPDLANCGVSWRSVARCTATTALWRKVAAKIKMRAFSVTARNPA